MSERVRKKNAVRQVLDLKVGERVWLYASWEDTRTRKPMVVVGEPRLAMGGWVVDLVDNGPTVAAPLYLVTRRVVDAPAP